MRYKIVVDSCCELPAELLRDLAGELFRMECASLSAVGRVSPAAEYAAWLGRHGQIT